MLGSDERILRQAKEIRGSATILWQDGVKESFRFKLSLTFFRVYPLVAIPGYVLINPLGLVLDVVGELGVTLNTRSGGRSALGFKRLTIQWIRR